MAHSRNEAVKILLTDVNKFVNVTLKSESLSPKAETERTKLVEALEKFYAANYSLAPNSGDEGSASSHKTPSISGSIEDSKNTCDSHGSEEDYDENISPTNLKSLENPTKLGYLDYKRQKEGQILPSTWQKKRYFVLHKRIMYCFKKPADQKQTSAFLVSGYEFQESPQHTKDSKRKECCFELIILGKKSHQFLADSKEDLQAWKEALKFALQAEKSSAKEDLATDEVDDLYEPLPGEGEIPQNYPKVQIQTESRPTVQITPEEKVDDDVYTDGTSDQTPVCSPAIPQPSPNNKAGGGLFGKFFKRKDPEASEKKDKTEDMSTKETEISPAADEFEDEEEIYEEVVADGTRRPPPPAPPTESAALPTPTASTKMNEVPPPNSSSITSATQAPTNAPKLPSRGPVPPPTSPTPPPPSRVPPASQPPPLPERELPPLPERDLPPLPEKDLPPLPQRGQPPRPPNIPVPPIPLECSPSSKDSQALQPKLDPSICHVREEDFENLYYSAYNCHGASDCELSFLRGDLIHVISRDLEPYSWWVGELTGKIGLVPKAFLVPAFTKVH